MTNDFFIGSKWVVARINGVEVDPSVPNGVDFEDGTVSGCVGVNRFHGKYELADGQVVLGPVATTMMAGPPDLMEVEQAFLSALNGELRITAITLGGIELRIAESQPEPITGTAMYRERMMLPPGSVFRVELQNVSRADAAAEVLASFVIEDAAAPPFGFSLSPSEPLDPSQSYAVRATITGPEGNLMWTTDAHFDPASDPLELLLVRV